MTPAGSMAVVTLRVKTASGPLRVLVLLTKWETERLQQWRPRSVAAARAGNPFSKMSLTIL